MATKIIEKLENYERTIDNLNKKSTLTADEMRQLEEANRAIVEIEEYQIESEKLADEYRNKNYIIERYSEYIPQVEKLIIDHISTDSLSELKILCSKLTGADQSVYKGYDIDKFTDDLDSYRRYVVALKTRVAEIEDEFKNRLESILGEEISEEEARSDIPEAPKEEGETPGVSKPSSPRKREKKVINVDELIAELDLRKSEFEASPEFKVEGKSLTEEDIKKITRVEAGKESRTTLENEIKFIEDAEKFRRSVIGRYTRNKKINNIEGYKLNGEKYVGKEKVSVLKKEYKEQDEFVNKYINEFATNPDFAKSEKMIELLGQNSRGRLGLARPTYTQHLKPIEDIDKKLKDEKLEEEEKKKLLEEKEKREKKIGKRALLKLKIDRVNSILKDLKTALKDAKTPEEKEKIKKEIEKNMALLAQLEKEYGKLLTEISKEMKESAEKSVYAKYGVKNLNELKTLRDSLPLDKNEADKGKEKKGEEKKKDKPDEKTGESEKKGKDEKKTGEGDEKGKGKESGATHAGTGPLAGGSSISGADVGGYSGTSSTGNKENLPAERKAGFWQKLKSLFKGKEEIEEGKDEKKELANFEVLETKKIEKDFAYDYAHFDVPAPRIVSGYLYRIDISGGEMRWGKEPIRDIGKNKNEVLETIQDLLYEYDEADFVGRKELENVSRMDRLKNFFKDKKTLSEYERMEDASAVKLLKKDPKAIYNYMLKKYMELDDVIDKEDANTYMACALRSVNLPQELLSAMNGRLLNKTLEKEKGRMPKLRLGYIPERKDEKESGKDTGKYRVRRKKKDDKDLGEIE